MYLGGLLMKKYSLVLLSFLLLFANVPLISAQEAISEVQEAVSPETEETYKPILTDPNSQNISWVAQKFGVLEDWIHNELAKGYTLPHMYEGLLEKQQGRSYEVFMQLRYPHTSERKSRQKRNPILVRGVVAVGGVVVRVSKPLVDDAVRAAKPYVNNAVKATVNFTKNVADDVAQGAKSMYQNITKGNSVRNIQTDVPKKTFERNLQSNGWSKTTDNGVNHFTKDGARYTTRNKSNQGSSTADYYRKGQRKPSTKIRLGD